MKGKLSENNQMLAATKPARLGFSCVLYNSGEAIAKYRSNVKAAKLRTEAVHEMKYGM